jgi:hypothetical protein
MDEKRDKWIGHFSDFKPRNIVFLRSDVLE